MFFFFVTKSITEITSSYQLDTKMLFFELSNEIPSGLLPASIKKCDSSYRSKTEILLLSGFETKIFLTLNQ